MLTSLIEITVYAEKKEYCLHRCVSIRVLWVHNYYTKLQGITGIHLTENVDNYAVNCDTP